MEHIKGPDFPTRGIIMGRAGIRAAYATGRGRRDRARAAPSSRSSATSRTRIVVTEIPYQVNKRMLIKSMADQVKDKRLEGISDIRDESDRTGMRIVIELKRDANAQVVLNRLFAQTQLQTTFADQHAGPRQEPEPAEGPLPARNPRRISRLSRRRSSSAARAMTCKKAQERAHLLEGLLIAQDNIDEVIRIIRTSYDNAKENLMQRFGSRRRAGAGHPRHAPEGACRASTARSSRTSIKELEDRIAYFRARARRLWALSSPDPQGRADRHPRQVRRRAPHRDSGRRGRDRHRGPHRGGGLLSIRSRTRGYIKRLPRRYLPHAAPRRPRRHRP